MHSAWAYLLAKQEVSRRASQTSTIRRNPGEDQE
jgi:hypothetical protein